MVDSHLRNNSNSNIRITPNDNITGQMEIRIFRLAYILPDDAAYTATLTSTPGSKEVKNADQSLIDVLSHVKTTTGSISFEKRANALVVRDSAKALDQMQSIIDKLDTPPQQMRGSARLVELSDEDAYRISRNWGQGIQPRKSGDYYGWPVYPMCSKHGAEFIESNGKLQIVYDPNSWYARAIAVNGLTAVAILFSVCFVCEGWIRRRAARKGT